MNSEQRTANSEQQERGRAGPRARSRHAGFTLVELILVILLLAVLGSVIVPRLAGNDRRQAELELTSIETFLTAAAERDAFSSQPIGISFDTAAAKRTPGMSAPAGQGQLTFWARRTIDPAKSEVPEWVQDPLVPAVTLTVLTLREATADGLRLEPRAWRINFPQSEPRPSISLLFSMVSPSTGGGGGRSGAPGPSWQIDLTTESLSPVRTSLGTLSLPHLAQPKSRSIDLDATGRGTQAW